MVRARRALLVVAGALTVFLALRMFWYLAHSIPDVPWNDQWSMLEEMSLHEQGKVNWSYLWTPYWGHRLFLPRLLYLASAKFFHYGNGPLVAVNLIAQFAVIGFFALAIGALLRGRAPEVRWLAWIAMAHLLLSSLQLEVIIWGMAVQLTLGYSGAIGAIVLWERGRWRTALALAVMGSLSMAVGMLVWPILFAEAWLLGSPASRKWWIAGLGVPLIALYSWHYVRIPGGMGLLGMLHNPAGALLVMSMVLGGPVSLFSLRLGEITGALGLAAAAYVFARFARRGRPAAETVMVMLSVFALGYVASLVSGRITPEALETLHGRDPLPSRYFEPGFLFWSALFPLALYRARDKWMGPAAMAAALVPVCALTFGTWIWEYRLPVGWAREFQQMNAAGNGFLIGASDEAYMAKIYPDAALRGRWIEMLRKKRYLMFSKPVAGWIGKEARSVLPKGRVEGCTLMDPVVTALASDPGIVRIRGKLSGGVFDTARAMDVVIADDRGMIAGAGKTIPAATENQPPVQFLAYARGPIGRVWVVPGDSRSVECLANPLR